MNHPQKRTAAFFVLTAALLLCPGTKSKAELPLEAADPDAGDLSAWKTIKPGLHSGFGSVDVAYSKSVPPAEDVAESIKLQGWKGERVHCQLLVWSPGAAENIRITASGFSNDQSQVKPEQVTVSVVDYVLADAFSGGINRPDKTKFPVHLKPDRLSRTNCFNLTACATRPRFAMVNSEFAAEFAKGPVTIAATTFLRYGNKAVAQMPPVPQGIFTLWLEEMKVPTINDEAVRKSATIIPMLSAAWQEKQDPDNLELQANDDRFKYDGKFTANPKLLGSWTTVAVVPAIDVRDWGEPIVKGEFAPGPDLKLVAFPRPVTAKFLKLVALSGFDAQPFAALAEFEVER